MELKELLDQINGVCAPNAIRACRADLFDWINFCIKKGSCSLSAAPFLFSEFLLALADAENNRKLEKRFKQARATCATQGSTTSPLRFSFSDSQWETPLVLIPLLASAT
jgi:hypothetical protein